MKKLIRQTFLINDVEMDLTLSGITFKKGKEKFEIDFETAKELKNALAGTNFIFNQ